MLRGGERRGRTGRVLDQGHQHTNANNKNKNKNNNDKNKSNNNNNNIYRDFKARAHTHERERTNEQHHQGSDCKEEGWGERGGRQGMIYKYASRENMWVSKRWIMERGRKALVGQRGEGQGGRGNTMNKWL